MRLSSFSSFFFFNGKKDEKISESVKSMWFGMSFQDILFLFYDVWIQVAVVIMVHL